MNNEKYYIESISDENDDEILTGIISSEKHGHCIIVRGNRRKLIERLIKIINGLNNGDVV